MDDASPNRCQYTGPQGQCRCERTEGSQFCLVHSKKGIDPELRHYLLTREFIREPTARHAAVEEIKSLREEIALTRMMAEQRLNYCETVTELISSMPQVNQLNQTTEKLVTSCHRMEVNLGSLLNKAAVIELAQEVVQILSNELEEVSNRNEIVDKVSARIIETIAKAEND